MIGYAKVLSVIESSRRSSLQQRTSKVSNAARLWLQARLRKCLEMSVCFMLVLVLSEVWLVTRRCALCSKKAPADLYSSRVREAQAILQGCDCRQGCEKCLEMSVCFMLVLVLAEVRLVLHRCALCLRTAPADLRSSRVCQTQAMPRGYDRRRGCKKCLEQIVCIVVVLVLSEVW